MAQRHYSVDIESTGTDPEHTAVIQLAAIEFDLDGKQLIPTRVFDRCMYIPESRRWDESTRDFWMSQPKHVLDNIWNRMEDPKIVLKAFGEWMGYADENYIWAKPTSFEMPFLSSYYREFEVPQPWHYRNGMDVNTWLRAKGIENPTKWAKEIPFVGDVHDAIADCIHQARTVISC